MSDEVYMKRALALAKKGAGWVSPNPMVGAVIVKYNRIIAEGWHQKYGEAHAEINAIKAAKVSPEGSTLYVTLEPCYHHGKTPPCVESVIAAKFDRVVVGMVDPNPLVSGKSIAALQAQGIYTTVGVLEAKCRELNETFIKYMETGMPYVTVKFAQTLDGRIATSTGHSQWISGEKSRRFAHQLRSFHDAVLVGAGTVLKDDPELTVRHVKGRNPLRIVLDPALEISLEAKILRDQDQARTLIVTRSKVSPAKQNQIQAMGVELLHFGDGKGQLFNLKALFSTLAKQRISSILIEGGSGIITSVLQAGLADRVVAIVAPKIVGEGLNAVGNLGITDMNQALDLTFEKITCSGHDVILDGRMK
ncbi:MAG: bifunctional diaminohydroxyphosphoribosylaminopyrimidine deaminase/5-amino-6-(5-phosphoribosylamino)uracil reductase RibD [Syntrophaceae bacterium]|nr:bifunctional diaminohydroxyphosphoribosylaminopyrimidine deaminase/5-amino-6-(5-phosphoribosylamino)uracil reductase RibD [Syntrophaceae bacterium]